MCKKTIMLPRRVLWRSRTARGSLLDRWTSYRTIGAIDAAVALLGPQQRAACPAFVIPLAGIGGHGFAGLMGTFRARQGRGQLDFALFCFHRAYAVRSAKMARVGNKTMSRTPIAALNPTVPSITTRMGVKQHNAVKSVPTTPILSNRLESMKAS